MAIVDPMSEVYTPLLSTSAKSAAFSPAIKSDFAMDLDTLLTQTPATHNTEPLVNADPSLDEVADVLLDDADEVEEGSDTGTLEELPGHSRPARATATRHMPGSEDAFQSYLRDIRG